MNLTVHLSAVLCVGMIAAGQVLFKFAARALHASGTFVDRDVLLITGVAMIVYAVATVVWIILLQTMPLGRLYPYMALSFVLVAFAGWLVFDESVAFGQIAGLVLIVIGLVVIAVT